MYDLVTRTQNEVHETRNWYTWEVEALRHSTTHIVYILNWIGNAVEHFLWSDDIDIFSVIDSLANEWYILKTEYGQLLLLNPLEAIVVVTVSKSMNHLAIESSLSKDTANECAILDVWLDLSNDFVLGMCR